MSLKENINITLALLETRDMAGQGGPPEAHRCNRQVRVMAFIEYFCRQGDTWQGEQIGTGEFE